MTDHERDDARHPMKVDQRCPECGSADRMYRAPASGYVRCAGCGWVGPEKVNQ